jgi:hypothetical protein
MKTIIKLRFVTAMVAVAAFILILDGCKKADLKSDAGNVNIDIAAEKAKVANLIAKEGGIPQIFTRKQPVTTMWVDRNRRPVTREQMQNNNFTSQCNYDLPAFCNLVQYARVYACADGTHSAGYYLQFEYEMSWNNNVIPYNAGLGQRTAGYVDIVDGSNNIVQSLTFDNTNSDVQIVEIGADPNISGNYIFRVKFVPTQFNSQVVSDTYINSGSYDVKFSALFVSDCATGGDPYSLWTNPVTSYGFTGASGDDPCDRNDKAWVTTSPSGGGTMIVAGYNGGFTFTCGYGGSFVAPDLQQVQYDVDGGGWTNMDNYTAAGLGIANSAYVRGGDFCQSATLPTGTNHLVTVRYRNWKYIGSSPWSIPNTTNDCTSPMNTSLPSGQQFYST